MPSEKVLARWQRVRAIMNEILQRKGLVEAGEEKVYVAGLKGPLEEGWQQKVEAFVDRIPAAAKPLVAADDEAEAATGNSAIRP